MVIFLEKLLNLKFPCGIQILLQLLRYKNTELVIDLTARLTGLTDLILQSK